MRIPRLPFAMAAASAGAALWASRREQARAERLAAALLETLLYAMDANDAETGAHVRRVATYALILAEALDLDDSARHEVERVALFHDIGKIHEALFDIIHDGAALSHEEREAIRSHPRRGADVLAPIAAFYPELPDAVLTHHERWDGKGYPLGLSGEQIPLSARIVAICDAFDAITADRRYRRGKDFPEAGEILREGAGKQWDPLLVDIFLSDETFARVETARAQAFQPSVEVDRREGNELEEAPDVSFRWRSTTPRAAVPQRAHGLTADRSRPDDRGADARRDGTGRSTRESPAPPAPDR